MRAPVALALISILATTASAAMAQSSSSTPPAATSSVVAPLKDISLGSPTAKVKVDVYASMTCVHCASFETKTFPELKTRYIDTGLVQYTIKPYPLDGLGAAAFLVARCDGDDKFYPRVEKLFAEQEKWAFSDNPSAALSGEFASDGYTTDKLQSCLSNEPAVAWILSTQDYANQQIKIAATPTIVVNGTVYTGDMPYDDLSRIIDPLLQ